jgi:hypothetical protein
VCAGDFNCDDRVDFADYLDFVSAFRRHDPPADINGDDQIDQADLAAFLAAYRGGC